ncbi:MAG TPA: helix-hairpin-helix domain-containing protein [Chloroflexota bacterium]|nr:helix-hairpin-helix domain-containing protein [Chloroflexota bacterium]
MFQVEPEHKAAGLGNREAAQAIFSVASLLESQGANPYRVRAYRRAALGMLLLPVEARRLLNAAGELELPWLGELLRRGRMQFYDDLLEELPRPFRELIGVPGIGPKFAARLMHERSVFGLADLAAAAGEGRLRTMRGVGALRERRWGAAAEAMLAEAA